MRTPLRNIRVDDDLWNAAQQAAEREGTTVSAVVVEALARYVRRHPPTDMTAAEIAQEKRKKKIRAAITNGPAPTEQELAELSALLQG